MPAMQWHCHEAASTSNHHTKHAESRTLHPVYSITHVCQVPQTNTVGAFAPASPSPAAGPLHDGGDDAPQTQ
jgi:hypothetical protein